MTEVLFLGVGGAMAVDPADNHTALLVRETSPSDSPPAGGGATVLLDCGPTIMRQLERVGVSAGDLTHLILTHQHGDHSLGLPMLLLNRVLFWPERPLWVLGLQPVLEVLKKLVAMTYPDLTQRMNDAVRFLSLEAGARAFHLPDSDITTGTAPGTHTVRTLAIRLSFANGTSLVYSGDTGPCAAIARLAAGTNLLVHESFYLQTPAENHGNHSAAEPVGQIAAQAGVGTLALVHREDTRAQVASQYAMLAAKHFAGPILVPNAGDRFTIPEI